MTDIYLTISLFYTQRGCHTSELCWEEFSADVYSTGLLNCRHLGVAVGVCNDFQQSSE